jgi:hypothetical protein
MQTRSSHQLNNKYSRLPVRVILCFYSRALPSIFQQVYKQQIRDQRPICLPFDFPPASAGAERRLAPLDSLQAASVAQMDRRAVALLLLTARFVDGAELLRQFQIRRQIPPYQNHSRRSLSAIVSAARNLEN